MPLALFCSACVAVWPPHGWKGSNSRMTAAGIAVMFEGQHDDVVASVSMKDDDADHEGGGEVPAVGECEGLRH